MKKLLTFSSFVPQNKYNSSSFIKGNTKHLLKEEESKLGRKGNWYIRYTEHQMGHLRWKSNILLNNFCMLIAIYSI